MSVSRFPVSLFLAWKTPCSSFCHCSQPPHSPRVTRQSPALNVSFFLFLFVFGFFFLFHCFFLPRFFRIFSFFCVGGFLVTPLNSRRQPDIHRLLPLQIFTLTSAYLLQHNMELQKIQKEMQVQIQIQI